MDENTLFLLIFLGAIILLALVIIVIYSFCHISLFMREKRELKKYPNTINFIQRYDNVLEKLCAWHNKYIAPLRRKIDYLQRTKKYLPKSEVEKVEKEVETLKEKLFVLQNHYEKRHETLIHIWNTTGKELANKENYPYFHEKTEKNKNEKNI